jgi:hypothetical protein
MNVIGLYSKSLGPEHPSTLDSMANLGSIYQEQERWKEALDLNFQVMKARKEVLGPEHPDTLSAMASMGSIYREEERWEKAASKWPRLAWSYLDQRIQRH